MDQKIEAAVISVEDDLEQLVDEINCASWEDTNDMPVYDVLSLRDYLGSMAHGS